MEINGVPSKKPSLNITLREWQDDCLEEQIKSYDEGRDTFFVAAGVGSGKTTLSLSFYLLTDFDLIIAIGPRIGILGSWEEDSLKMGINIQTVESSEELIKTLTSKQKFNLPHGFLMTPGMIVNLREQLQLLCCQYKILLVLDEAHHYGEDMTWGEDIYEAFHKADFRMAASGTPYRTDMNKIACLLYGPSGLPGELEGIPEFIYPYEQSLQDGNVAPIVTRLIGGSVSTQTGTLKECFDFADGDYSEMFGSENMDLIRRRLRLATIVSDEWQHAAIKEARKCLIAYRKDGNPWAGLITCSTIEQSTKIAKHIKDTYNDRVETIVDSANTIKAVKKVNEDKSIDWVVSITKVSEGVSISRLRVGLLLSNVTTRNFFEQLRGRLARLYKNVPATSQPATFFIPKDPRLVEFALTANKLITDNVTWIGKDFLSESGLENARKLRSELDLNAQGLTIDCGDFYISGDAVLDGTIDIHGNMLSEKEVNLLREKVLEMGLKPLHISNYSVEQLKQTEELWDSI